MLTITPLSVTLIAVSWMSSTCTLSGQSAMVPARLTSIKSCLPPPKSSPVKPAWLTFSVSRARMNDCLFELKSVLRNSWKVMPRGDRSEAPAAC